jgi:hypothetical protein
VNWERAHDATLDTRICVEGNDAEAVLRVQGVRNRFDGVLREEVRDKR